MSQRGRLGWSMGSWCLVAAMSLGVSCYRAEIDLAPLLDETTQAKGGAATLGAGDSAEGGSAAAAATTTGGSATTGGRNSKPCDPTPDEHAQAGCRIRLPSLQACDEQDVIGWSGCYDGGCSICVNLLVDYPHYFDRHPCCQPNDTCSVHSPRPCSALCPPPTPLDKLSPCYNLER